MTVQTEALLLTEQHNGSQVGRTVTVRCGQ